MCDEAIINFTLIVVDFTYCSTICRSIKCHIYVLTYLLNVASVFCLPMFCPIPHVNTGNPSYFRVISLQAIRTFDTSLFRCFMQRHRSDLLPQDIPKHPQDTPGRFDILRKHIKYLCLLIFIIFLMILMFSFIKCIMLSNIIIFNFNIY